MVAPAAPGIEVPSGKNAGTENFPVGSLLLPRPLRPHVMAFYGFARATDDIADDTSLAPADKIARLRRFAAALVDPAADGPGLEKAAMLRASLARTGVPARHALDLVDAFIQDAEKTRYADWDDLIGYCNRSAAPVGRFLLDLHGEDRALWPASDALCNALQVLNHLQDVADDYRDIDRVYLPMPWFTEAGAEIADLKRGAATPAVRRILDRALDGTDALLRTSAALAPALASTGLALETAAIQALAERLARLLRVRDPLAERVKPGKPAMLATALAGVAATALTRLLGRKPATRDRETRKAPKP
jgi:squalene synthase HpnC